MNSEFLYSARIQQKPSIAGWGLMSKFALSMQEHNVLVTYYVVMHAIACNEIFQNLEMQCFYYAFNTWPSVPQAIARCCFQ